jgi:hypothetical protein
MMKVIEHPKPIERKNEMHTMIRWFTRSIMPVVLLGCATVATAHERHGGYSAGEPGNPKKPAREIVVEMSEMDYAPSVIEVKRGEQVPVICSNYPIDSGSRRNSILP